MSRTTVRRWHTRYHAERCNGLHQQWRKLHYNYWSSNFGYSGSHGCLGLSLVDNLFLWNWAEFVTPIIIRS